MCLTRHQNAIDFTFILIEALLFVAKKKCFERFSKTRLSFAEILYDEILKTKYLQRNRSLKVDYSTCKY